MAEGLDQLSEACGAHIVSAAIRALNATILDARKYKMTKSQYVLFLLADMMTCCEVGEALCKKACGQDGGERPPEFMRAAARLFAREVVEKVYLNGLKIAYGYDQTLGEAAEQLGALPLAEAMRDNLKDMDLVAAALVK
jgi:alkylation response protein AidB-like acyl-CoA dehydrogenase